MKYKTIGKQGQAVLLEWVDSTGNLQRSTLPADYAGLVLTEQDLADGIPFGATWRVDDAAMSKLANRLHEHGIWTYVDAANRIREFRSIVNEIVVASLLDAARGGR